ncbi:hypothetical protein VDG1235_609 [Verrucomicrobiia bacterium DG1235]|nr:hypothetical protein VDG1235_609 [Verrucomicrobiae bacterium DG1235]
MSDSLWVHEMGADLVDEIFTLGFSYRFVLGVLQYVGLGRELYRR